MKVNLVAYCCEYRTKYGTCTRLHNELTKKSPTQFILDENSAFEPDGVYLSARFVLLGSREIEMSEQDADDFNDAVCDGVLLFGSSL